MISKKSFEKTSDGLIVRIKLIPNSSRNEIIQTPEGLKVKITAQPIENRANKFLVEFFAKMLKLPKTSIIIVKGELSREKTLLFKGIDEEFFKNKIPF